MRDFLLEQAILKFDIYEFLDENDIEYSKTNRNVGTGWIGIEECIFCGAGNYHGGINESALTYSCWKCPERGNLVTIIMKVMNFSYEEAREYILEYSQIDVESVDLSVKIIFKQAKQIQPKPKEIKTNLVLPESFRITSNMITNNPAIHDFCKMKHISSQDCILYNLRIGIDGNNKGRMIIPIYHDRRLVAYQARTMVGGKSYKSEGSIKSFLFKIDSIPLNKTIVLVEGFFDYLTTYKFVSRFLKNKVYVTTPFSKIITNEQISLLKSRKPKEVISLWDYDAWFKNSFQDRLVCDTGILIPPTDKDPNEMTKKDFLQVFRGFFNNGNNKNFIHKTKKITWRTINEKSC